ncbi:hypothetical protein EKK97_14090 [Billgrantia tianxiuensis]|uniref:Uncharacterized protein n=1 Tax=Billgrantia tianxiuensis TaxID=2497861 RepID=A0A6I6SSE0_9GAMM|nr:MULTISPECIES: hypothetical protein [Halomonas]MCE8034629.1 hypothetical protein [Halomonas sp. MCCC 1A11057]QHC50495.1 hypothetical protein EKK97_14090 [Halomonas tianxiuensis]
MKIKVYATSSGDRNACMLIDADSPIPPGFTDQEPLPPKAGNRVVFVDGGWVYEPIPPVTGPSVSDLAADRRAVIDAASVAELDQVRRDYPDYEQLSWERQEREAREGGGPLIQAIADARGVAIEELISRIIAKADAYQQAAAAVIGRRQALRDQIVAIEHEDSLDNDAKREAINSINW